MVSCFGKTHNLTTTTKKHNLNKQGVFWVFFFPFPFCSNSPVLHQPPSLPCSSTGHKITSAFFFSPVFNHSEKHSYLVHLGSDFSITRETGLINKSHKTYRVGHLLDSFGNTTSSQVSDFGCCKGSKLICFQFM